MARIFVSYSRKNKDFCKQLAGEFQKRDMDIWVDWDGIPPTVDWMKEIEKGIEEADTFLAIVSTDWISSKVCIDELEIAVKNGKRLIPVVPYDINWNDVPSALAQLNFIFFTDNTDFNTQLELLLKALDTDYDWLKTHRRLQVKALEWERSNKENGFLLRGKDLEEAEEQLAINANKEPYPTDLQHDYALKSRQATDRQRRFTTGGLTIAVIVLMGIIVSLVYPSVAEWVAKGQARGELLMMDGGNFYMGAINPEIIQSGERAVWLASLPTFYIEKYEVTNRQFGLCVDHGGCTPPGNLEYFQGDEWKDYPVLQVNVYQANSYCQWIGRRLPNELEWIRAARGLNDPRYWPWGNTPPTSKLVNMPLDNETSLEPQPVTNFATDGETNQPQNLVGNALEWTSSYFQQDYHFGNADYDYKSFWNGQVDEYNGNKPFIRLGGGFQRPISYLAEIAPFAGYNTDENTGFRCASD